MVETIEIDNTTLQRFKVSAVRSKNTGMLYVEIRAEHEEGALVDGQGYVQIEVMEVPH